MLKEVASAGILGVGVYIPENIRKNDFWNNIPIQKHPKGRNSFEGIEERRAFDENVLPSDLEIIAGKRAIEDAGISPDDIDLVIVHSMLQDELIPGNASLIQYKLGLKNAGAWNMDTCCSSFVTMAVTAANLIANKEFRNILIISSVIHSRMTYYTDYYSPWLGDGIGAVVIGQVPDDRGYIASYCTSQGYYHNAFTLTERMPINQQTRTHYETMPCKPVLTFTQEKTTQVGRNSNDDMKEILDGVLHKADMTAENIDLFLSHQPCHWAHDVWRDSIGVPKEKGYQTYRKYGNMASAVIPINLFEARNNGMIKDGDNLLMASSGAGKNHISAIFKWFEKNR